jgi:hypothetical protein
LQRCRPGLILECQMKMNFKMSLQVGHRFVLEQLVDYIYHGFLVSVVKPALFEVSDSMHRRR